MNEKPPLPAYLKCGIPKDVWRDVARFRTSSHHLSIETGRWRRPVPTPLSERICNLCDSGAVQDEQHVLLECNFSLFVALRSRYSSLLESCEGDMNTLMSDDRAKDLSWFIHAYMQVIDAEYRDNLDNVLEETASSPVKREGRVFM